MGATDGDHPHLVFSWLGLSGRDLLPAGHWCISLGSEGLLRCRFQGRDWAKRRRLTPPGPLVAYPCSSPSPASGRTGGCGSPIMIAPVGFTPVQVKIGFLTLSGDKLGCAGQRQRHGGLVGH